MIPRRPGIETVQPVIEKQKMPHLKPFVITEKMTPGQKKTANDFNAMRQALLDNGIMEMEEGES